MKFLLSLTLTCLIATQSLAADYNFVDPGDTYFINDWGADNRHVVIVRKLGNGSVKVRDVATGEASVVRATQLLTRNQLSAEETGNAVVGTAIGVAIVVCLVSPESCEKKN